jgi:phospholipase/carboxylesterase
LLEEEATAANRAVPIFAAHGSDDDVVSPELGIRARDFLTGRGYCVEWREYPMPHSVCLEEVQEIGRWLKARMTPSREQLP